MTHPAIALIKTAFTGKGAQASYGEAVTQQAHALQSAELAEAAGAPDSLIAAAFLHDIGHLLHGLGEDIAEQGIDAVHQDVGADWLARHFGPDVTEPVRLHVAAKRYLCGDNAGYRAGLSPASERSLRLQGGPMDGDERRAFEGNPHWRAAIDLRRWDDAAKIRNKPTPPVGHFMEIVSRCVSG
jgi:phosphonate degradation associated HDIG domain protein